ncbi:RDD family protein [Chryseobacterium sp. M5]|uniref:RDD family protein n=1 Tax=Chryseobacterium sp. M5 TaxID=3379128 RepID=UPI0038577044
MRKHLKIIEDNKASQGLRFANYIIDLIALVIINFFLSLISIILYNITLNSFFYYFYNNSSFLWDYMMGIIVATIYYFLWENFSNGRTLGKLITNTKVLSIDGTKPSTTQILYRSLCRAVPFNALSFLGYNGWHDSWTETRVINITKYTEAVNAKMEIDNIGVKEIA